MRADELGRRTELWLAGSARDGTVTTSTVEALRRALPRGGQATGVLITTEPPTEEVRDAADRLGIEVWRL